MPGDISWQQLCTRESCSLSCHNLIGMPLIYRKDSSVYVKQLDDWLASEGFMHRSSSQACAQRSVEGVVAQDCLFASLYDISQHRQAKFKQQRVPGAGVFPSSVIAGRHCSVFEGRDVAFRRPCYSQTYVASPPVLSPIHRSRAGGLQPLAREVCLPEPAPLRAVAVAHVRGILTSDYHPLRPVASDLLAKDSDQQAADDQQAALDAPDEMDPQAALQAWIDKILGTGACQRLVRRSLRQRLLCVLRAACSPAQRGYASCPLMRYRLTSET